MIDSTRREDQLWWSRASTDSVINEVTLGDWPMDFLHYVHPGFEIITVNDFKYYFYSIYIERISGTWGGIRTL